MFGGLAAIGLTRGRWVSQDHWVLLWASASVLLVAVMVSAFLAAPGAFEFAYGLAVGYVAAVTVHTSYHAATAVRRARTPADD